MGNKIKVLAAAVLAAVCSVAAAGEIEAGLTREGEDAGATTTKVYTVVRSGSLGVRVQRTNWSYWSQTAAGAGLDLQEWWSWGGIEGYAVVESAGGNRWIDSDIEARYEVVPGLIATTNVWSGTLSNVGLEPGTINYRGVGAGLEWSNSRWGWLGSVRWTDRTDGNSSPQTLAKVWYSPLDGVTVFASSKHTSNKFQNNLYFSPDSYVRNGVGATWRGSWQSGYIKVSAERNWIKVSGSRDAAVVGKVVVGQRLGSGRIEVEAGRDYSLAESYLYRYVGVVFKADF